MKFEKKNWERSLQIMFTELMKGIETYLWIWKDQHWDALWKQTAREEQIDRENVLGRDERSVNNIRLWYLSDHQHTASSWIAFQAVGEDFRDYSFRRKLRNYGHAPRPKPKNAIDCLIGHCQVTGLVSAAAVIIQWNDQFLLWSTFYRVYKSLKYHHWVLWQLISHDILPVLLRTWELTRMWLGLKSLLPDQGGPRSYQSTSYQWHSNPKFRSHHHSERSSHSDCSAQGILLLKLEALRCTPSRNRWQSWQLKNSWHRKS